MNRMNSLKKGLRQVAYLMSRYQAALLPRMLCAVLHTRSVNLQQWAAVLAGAAQPASHYRRLQRFLSGTWSPQVATQLIVQQLVKPGKPILLTLDRTRYDPSQSVVLGLSASARVDSVGIRGTRSSGQLLDGRSAAGVGSCVGLSAGGAVLSVGRPRVYRRRLAAASAGARGGLCHSLAL